MTKLAGLYIAGIAGWRPLICLSFWQLSIFVGKVVPLLLPETFVYRHNVALCSKDVLVIGSVERIVLIKQLQLKTNMHDCKKYTFVFLDQIITTVTITAASLCQKGHIAIILADTVTVMSEFLKHTSDSQSKRNKSD